LNDALITWAGFARASERLDRLKTVGRREVTERIRDALQTETNANESADYLDARAEQARLERKIAELELRLARAKIVEPDGRNGVVDVGERVRLQDLETEETVEYELVGSLESDPTAGRICAASPVGRALLGRREGEIAVVEAPMGRVTFEILGIDTPPEPRVLATAAQPGLSGPFGPPQTGISVSL
jgi:transcription elongation factor GreA